MNVMRGLIRSRRSKSCARTSGRGDRHFRARPYWRRLISVHNVQFLE